MKEKIKQMRRLRTLGFTYKSIGLIHGISRQRAYQLIGRQGKEEASNAWYNTLREAVFTRDNHKCQKCGVTQALTLHHINADKTDNELTNLITLCNSCHCRIRENGIHRGLLYADENTNQAQNKH